MEGYCIFKKNRVKLFYCIRNICDSGQSIFKHANFTELVNSLMTYVGGKLLVFITIKKNTYLAMPCVWMVLTTGDVATGNGPSC